MQVLKMTSESVALDELGIGRIRDAFADRMFPGISTLQQHVKYFSLMPQVYHKATEKRYNRLSEVKAEIVRLERIMTKNLYEGSRNKKGITGSDTIGKGTNSYVKYDPAYIYNSGLQTFEILRSAQVEELIYSASKAKVLNNEFKILKTEDEDVADDIGKYSDLFQLCPLPHGLDYDFTKACSLDLTDADRDFIIDHILTAKACQGTLLRYLVDNPKLKLPKEFEDLGDCPLPKDLAELQDLARRFADFIYMVHVRYNYIYSDYQDEDMYDEFMRLLRIYKSCGTNIESVLAAVDIREDSSKWFCKEISQYIAAEDIEKLDQTIINRERRVKGSRRKIGNPVYKYNSRKRIHYYKLTYRWETVRQFIEELRKEAANG